MSETCGWAFEFDMWPIYLTFDLSADLGRTLEFTSDLYIWPFTIQSKLIGRWVQHMSFIFDHWPLTIHMDRQLALTFDLYIWPLTFQQISGIWPLTNTFSFLPFGRCHGSAEFDLWPIYLTSDLHIWPLSYLFDCWPFSPIYLTFDLSTDVGGSAVFDLSPTYLIGDLYIWPMTILLTPFLYIWHLTYIFDLWPLTFQRMSGVS